MSLARIRRALAPAALAFALLQALSARAGVWSSIDRFDENEATGIWSRSNQRRLDTLMIAGVVGTALWEGTETRLGHTAWQSLDAALMTAGVTETTKRIFGRPRPSQDSDPGTWFAGSRYRSFPSGEVAMMAAFVTPFVREYHEDQPAAWALAALPLYMARARMASQSHWLTDVVAGGAIGAGVGWYASSRQVPVVLWISRRSTFVGLHYRF